MLLLLLQLLQQPFGSANRISWRRRTGPAWPGPLLRCDSHQCFY